MLLSATAPLLVVDDSLFKRSGRKVFGTAWHYDAAAPGRHRVAWDNNWSCSACWWPCPCLPHRRVYLPALARLWQLKHPDLTRLRLARELVWLVAAPTAKSARWQPGGGRG